MAEVAWIKWTLLALATLTVVVAVLAAYGASRWSVATRELTERLETARLPAVPVRYDAARELEGLPEPVQRYFHTALTDGQPIVTAATVEHRGTFNMSETADQWKPFTSWQRVVTRRPGFVWDGKVAMLPGLNVHVHDAYVKGEGILRPAILGLFTLIDLRGTGEVAHGELMRFLAEAPTYPTALLPSQGVRWQGVDERSATATMDDGPLNLTLLFRFNDDGLIDSVLAQMRGRMVGKDIVMTPWEGHWSNYQLHDGMRVPMSGEVAWLTPQGRKPYWRGTVTALSLEFSK